MKSTTYMTHLRAGINRKTQLIYRLLHKHSLLHPHQFGFVQGGSCEAPIEVANDMYEHACENDEELHVAFLDATTSAFDTVQHPALTAAFAAIGAAPSIVR